VRAASADTAPAAARGRVSLGVAALGLAAWLLTTVVFWIGYVGSDDIFYGRYAWLFHRPPMNWWEFRMPAVLAIRASFLAFGPTEVAAALPTLLASLSILASVTWFTARMGGAGWWTGAAVAIVATLPLDVGFRSVPGATYFATGFLASGTACLLAGKGRVPYAGAVLLALGFEAHEISLFYVAIVCLTALAFDRRRFLRPVVACVAVSVALIAVECLVYQRVLGKALARFTTSAATTSSLPIGYDPDTGIGGLRFFTWPIENVVFCKGFGFDLAILLAAGWLAWKHLAKEQRILLVATFATWAWLGYGSQVPWAYKPLYRQVHYYGPLVLGVASLLPVAVSRALGPRAALAKAVIAMAVLVHLVCLGFAGRWGQDVEVSRELLRHACEHRDQTFVTDVATMNHMYAIGGYALPANVVCINGPAVEVHLRENKEPPSKPRFRFPDVPIDGVLLNLEGLAVKAAEPEFLEFVRAHEGAHTEVAKRRYRALFVPLLAFTEPKDFMLRSLGGEVVMVPPPASAQSRPK
jgi:hypothetical protein